LNTEEMQARLAELELENRKLKREVRNLNNAIAREKTAYVTVLNQQKASTFVQRARDRYLAILLENSPNTIAFVGHTNRIEFCTSFFVRSTGFAQITDVLGRTVHEVFGNLPHFESSQNFQDALDAAVISRNTATFEAMFQNRIHENKQRYFNCLFVPMNDDDGNDIGYILMLHDVTTLKRSQEEALAASKAKSNFLSSMSHEIRTPMNAIIGMTAIGRGEKDISRKNLAFEKIGKASTHLLGVVNDILDISKIESGKMELAFADFSLSHMIDTVLVVVAQNVRDKHQKFYMNIDSSIPDRLNGDDQRLAQVITNILSNAVKFTPEGGNIRLNIKLLELLDDGNRCKIQISVKDSGIGISEEQQKKLFSAFQQAEAGTSRKYGGSGLGLVISKRIIEMMHGDIEVVSGIGKGSYFNMTAVLGIAESNSSDGQDDAVDVQNVDLSGKTILVVDDIDINLEIVSALLEPTNLTVETATGGIDAIEAFKADPSRYDLIFMDMQMPEMDGLQTTEIIRNMPNEQAKSVPIIAMTANVFKEDIEKCLNAGMNGHLGKPIDINEAVKVLVHYLK